MTFDLAVLRESEFPWAARGECIYLNNAGTGPVPERTLLTIAEQNARRARPWTIRFEDELAITARARDLAARLVGATAAEIALMTNTTHGINVAARCLPLRRGDVVLSPDREFPSNVYPWLALGTDGIRLERIPPRPDGLPDEERLLNELARRDVRAVTLSWVSFATGYTFDLATIGRACRDRGIYFVVDAMQGLGPLTIDVRASDIDLFACGGQKWLLAPWGTGFIYVREALVRELEPNTVGWMQFAGSEDLGKLTGYETTLRDDARRFEVNTLPLQDVAGFSTSVELLLQVGLPEVSDSTRVLADMVVEWTRAARDVELVTPADRARRAGIVAIRPSSVAAASARLTRAGVVHAVREGAIRLAPYFYNTREETALALDALDAGGRRGPSA